MQAMVTSITLLEDWRTVELALNCRSSRVDSLGRTLAPHPRGRSPGSPSHAVLGEAVPPHAPPGALRDGGGCLERSAGAARCAHSLALARTHSREASPRRRRPACSPAPEVPLRV
ncbi:hypothetical protein H8959_011100 [Pygathrix nigripes]